MTRACCRPVAGKAMASLWRPRTVAAVAVAVAVTAAGGVAEGPPRTQLTAFVLTDVYVTFRLNFHHFDRFELDLRGLTSMYMCGAPPSPVCA